MCFELETQETDEHIKRFVQYVLNEFPALKLKNLVIPRLKEQRKN